MSMTIEDLVRAMVWQDGQATPTAHPAARTRAQLDKLFATIADELAGGREVRVPGFGTFTPVERGARPGRNPQTGAAIEIPASTQVRFKPATALRSRLNPERTVAPTLPKRRPGARPAA